MNSFNHYAYGAVGDWMYRNLAGIDLDPEEPAYSTRHHPPTARRRLHPRRGASNLSIRGPIATDWRVEKGTFTLKVSIPSNAPRYRIRADHTTPMPSPRAASPRLKHRA